MSKEEMSRDEEIADYLTDAVQDFSNYIKGDFIDSIDEFISKTASKITLITATKKGIKLDEYNKMHVKEVTRNIMKLMGEVIEKYNSRQIGDDEVTIKIKEWIK